jgi:hypothetical protein
MENGVVGSCTDFRKRERPPLSVEEKELSYENKIKIGFGISILRDLKNRILEEGDAAENRRLLAAAHKFSAVMAAALLGQMASEKILPLAGEFLEMLDEMKSKNIGDNVVAASGVSPQVAAGNLLLAADDLLLRVEDKVKSLAAPDHKLGREEIGYVLNEFLIGTNNLSVNAIGKFFAKDTQIGGILSGGLVYVEMVKILIAKYADPDLTINTFAIAVNKHQKKTAFEISDPAAKTVIIADDMISGGGTILAALWAAGEYFPNATIYTGIENDYPGQFEKRRQEPYEEELMMMFQDCSKLSKNGRMAEADAIWRRAYEYAQENKIEMKAGWQIIRERIDDYEKNKKGITLPNQPPADDFKAAA